MTVAVTGRAAREQLDALAHGVLFVHACPRALAPHVDWALSAVFGTEVRLAWEQQSIVPGHSQASAVWTDAPGTASKVASALRPLTPLRFEITEDPSAGRDGERFVVTPNLGLFRATMGRHGDVMVHEDRIRQLLTDPDPNVLELISRLIGTPWDDELEPFRAGHGPSTVRLLHQVV